MAVLFHPGADPSRIYYGTDTRLFDLMAGATLAFLAASRPQPSASARRTLHAVAPAAAAVLAVFWVTAGTPGGLPTNFMFEGGFLICAVLAGLVVADARLIEPGRFSRALAWPPLHFIGTISYGIYLWHWPVIVYLNGAADRALDPAARPRAHRRHAGPVDGQLLPGRAADPAGPPGRSCACGAHRWPASSPRSSSWWPRSRPSPIPSKVVGTTHLASTTAQDSVPGAGGYAGQKPIRPECRRRPRPTRSASCCSATRSCTTPPTASRRRCRPPARSVVTRKTIDGFGLTTATNWPTSFPTLIGQTQAQLIVASWSWDQYGPTTPNALHQPVQYTKLLTPGRQHDARRPATAWRG